jgi:phosphoglycolate phosphatase-like HAD superfamily hydrolase
LLFHFFDQWISCWSGMVAAVTSDIDRYASDKSAPDLLALDFDGVICNGLQEYFQTAWVAHYQLWAGDPIAPPEGLAEAFYRLRPIVETGWEMPVVIHALRSGFSEQAILADWANISIEMLQQHHATPQQVGALVDQLRDHAIQTQLQDWLATHTFYPGVIDRLKSLEHWLIISTKEGRFIQQLLAGAGIELSPERIFGKEQKRPKYVILRELKAQYQSIWFIEDRFKTLETVQNQPDLQDIQLFLADWGYNLPAERTAAQQSDRLRLINLAQFSQDFSAW